MIEVGIVGGGPAGSYCAYSLAENDVYPVIFDHTHPREKPCGGLISPLGQEMFSFLKRMPVKHSEINKILLITPSGKRICIRFRKSKMLGFSRLKLDQYLMNMAVEKGAELINEKVTALERKNNFWKVKTTKQSYIVKKLVGADGVNSLVRRKIVGPLGVNDKGVSFGYFVRGLEKEEVTIRFLSHREGYIWVIPRAENTSIGIGSAKTTLSYGLKNELDMFIEQYCPQVEKISRWTALTPNIKDINTLCVPLAGADWILIGDAAGHVNPISGEGIMYALLDGELAAEALEENNPQRFDELWRGLYGWSLSRKIKLRKLIYKRSILEFYCKYLKFRNVIYLDKSAI